MEIAIGAISSIGSALGIGGGAAGGAAAAGGGGLLGALGGSGSLITGILQGGATIASMMAASRAGRSESRALEMQAADAETDIRTEEVAGLARRNTLRRSLLDALGESDVAYAASGVDLSFGTPVEARRQSIVDAERALSTDRQTERMRTSRLKEKAVNLRLMASEARRGGLAKALGIGLEGGIDILARG